MQVNFHNGRLSSGDISASCPPIHTMPTWHSAKTNINNSVKRKLTSLPRIIVAAGIKTKGHPIRWRKVSRLISSDVSSLGFLTSLSSNSLNVCLANLRRLVGSRFCPAACLPNLSTFSYRSEVFFNEFFVYHTLFTLFGLSPRRSFGMRHGR